MRLVGIRCVGMKERAGLAVPCRAMRDTPPWHRSFPAPAPGAAAAAVVQLCGRLAPCVPDVLFHRGILRDRSRDTRCGRSCGRAPDGRGARRGRRGPLWLPVTATENGAPRTRRRHPGRYAGCWFCLKLIPVFMRGKQISSLKRSFVRHLHLFIYLIFFLALIW